jgi:murein hydrolase activator
LTLPPFSELARAVVLCAAGVLCAPTNAAEPAKKAGTARKADAPAARDDTRKPAPTRPSPERQKELHSEQQELRQELAKMKRQLMASEASRTDAADALAASEAAISRANRRLRELGQSRSQVERQIETLQQRSRAVAASQSRQQIQLAQALRQQYELTLRDPLLAFIAGENPSELGRDAEYHRYLGRAAAARIGELQERRSDLAELEEASRKKRDELAAIARDEDKHRADLVSEQARRKQAIDRLAKQIATQRQSIDKLERDDKRLAGLITQLSKVLAEQARRDAQRETAKAARESGAARPSPREPAPAPPLPGPGRPDADPPPGSRFAQLRGRLPMPVVGEVTARFGAPRRVEGAGTAPTWKGLFIRAPEGAGVHAVAAGQVVFADWLRGFGNLMVVDHGEGFLSVYGNNESLLRNVGDRVAVGDLVAAVGNTGGNEQTGLYFELRFQGRPFDPLRWVATR